MIRPSRPFPLRALLGALTACSLVSWSLTACSVVSPEARVRERLIAAGVKPRMAGCLAEALVHKLDTAELKQLDRVAKLPREHPGAMRFDELADRLRALDNPHIVNVVTRVGLGCAIAG